MMTKPFRLNRGCSVALVLTWVVMILIAVCMLRLLQLPNGLGSGLGHAGRLMNILVSTAPGQRKMLAVYDSKTVNLEFLDKTGLYGGYEPVVISDEEWLALNTFYDQWCTNPPKTVPHSNRLFYQIGLSCSTAFGRSIEVQETMLPPVINALFKRATLCPDPSEQREPLCSR
jgi:hypothetical protein